MQSAGDRRIQARDLQATEEERRAVARRVAEVDAAHVAEAGEFPAGFAVVVWTSGVAVGVVWTDGIALGAGFAAETCWWDVAEGEVVVRWVHVVGLL